jgi:hypothetical protein
MELDETGLEVLDAAQCWALLAAAFTARLALTDGALPVIVPIRHRLVGGDVVFAITGGVLLRAALANDVVCVQTDVDGGDATGPWTVVGTGVIELVTDRSDVDRLGLLVPPPWSPNPARCQIGRVRLGSISGRRALGLSSVRL